MQASLKISLAAALAAGLICTAAVAPSMAQPARATPHAAYGAYQGPDGGYASLSGYVRDVEGIPCGIKCTRAAQQRWSHVRVD